MNLDRTRREDTETAAAAIKKIVEMERIPRRWWRRIHKSHAMNLSTNRKAPIGSGLFPVSTAST
jgi:hypothetical protein